MGDTLEIKLTHPRFDSKIIQATYKIHQHSLTLTDNKVILGDLLLGKQPLVVSVHTEDGKEYRVEKEVLLLSATSPKLYHYNILNVYDHDPMAYTQGLEFVGDTLIESTGQ